MPLSMHMDTIDRTASALQDLSFAQPKAFVNALLSDRDITSLIRDAEPHEQALFSSHGSGTGGDTETMRRGPTPMRLQLRREAAALLSRSRGSHADGPTGPDEAGLAALLACVEKLLTLYPAQGVQAQVDLMRHKHAQLAQSIGKLEEEAEWQREELKSLSSARGNEFAAQDRLSGDGTEVITDEMLRKEEEEVRLLEQQVQGRHEQ